MSGGLPQVVIGDGWAALGAVGFVARAGVPVCWIKGTGAKIVPPLPSLDEGEGTGGLAWKELFRLWNIECGDLETGSFLREHRSKAFREPLWTQAPTPDARRQVIEETLWGAERVFAPVFESRFPRPLGEIESDLRRKLSESSRNPIRMIENVPVSGFKVSSHSIEAVLLGSGQEVPCSKMIYADRWSELPKLQGLPKSLGFLRRRDPIGILQASLIHRTPMGEGLKEGFFGALHRESGEEFERHVWGFFSSDGLQSHWTLALSSDESEDNHEIAKRLRRMKNALDKMFVGSSWLPEGKPDFMSNVGSEQVRFEESMLFSKGAPVAEPVGLPQIPGVCFLTDGYGPGLAMRQARLLQPETQAENVNLMDTIST